MFKKAVVFGRQHGFDKQRGNFVEFHHPAFFPRLRIETRNDFRLCLDSPDFSLIVKIGQAFDPPLCYGQQNPSSRALSSGIRGFSQKNLDFPALDIAPIVSPSPNRVFDLLIIQAGQMVEESYLFDIESGIKEERTRVDLGWDCPAVGQRNVQPRRLLICGKTASQEHSQFQEIPEKDNQ